MAVFLDRAISLKWRENLRRGWYAFLIAPVPGFGEKGVSFSESLSRISHRERPLSKFWKSTNEEWIITYLSNKATILE